LPNVIKIDLYNFEVYRFKVGAFFSEKQCTRNIPQPRKCTGNLLGQTMSVEVIWIYKRVLFSTAFGLEE